MNAVEEFARILKAYRVNTINGDRYAGEWPVEAFAVTASPTNRQENPKSDLYVSSLPLLTSVMVELVDNPRLIAQIASLERRTARSGKDSIDHPPGGHDDFANAVAGVARCWPRGPAYDLTRSGSTMTPQTPQDLLRQEQLRHNATL